MKTRKKKVTQRVTSKIDGRTDRMEAVEVAVLTIADAIKEMRETIRDLRTNQGLAHSVEVSKRLDGYRASMQQSLSALKQLIDMHVGAYEKRLAVVEEQMLHDRVLALEEIVFEEIVPDLSKKKGK